MSNEELTNMIIKELGKLRDPKEITRKVCEQSTMNWNDAQRLVDEVAVQNKRKIAAKQSRLLIFLSIGILLLGIGLLIISAQFIFNVFQSDTMGQVLSIRRGYYALAEFVTGLGMTIGGFYGAWKTLADLLPE